MMYSRSGPRQGQRLQQVQGVEREHPPVGDEDHPPQAKALAQALDDPPHRGHLADIPLEHFMGQRQARGGLHHPHRHLPVGPAHVLGVAVPPQVALHRTVPGDPYRGQVVEQQVQGVGKPRQQHRRQPLFQHRLARPQRVHGPQQPGVGDLGPVHTRHAHRGQPPQHPQLRLRVGQPVEHQHPDAALHRRPPGSSPQAGQDHRLQPQLPPQPVQHPHIAQLQRRLEGGSGGADRLAQRGQVGSIGQSQQPVDHPVHVGRRQLVQSPQRRQVALPGRAVDRITVGLHQLDVTARTRTGDFHIHATTIAAFKTSENIDLPKKRATTNELPIMYQYIDFNEKYLIFPA